MAEYKDRKCPKCDILLENIHDANFKRHINSKECKRNQKRGKNRIKTSDYKVSENEYECPHCGKTYTKMGIGTHIWRTHDKKGKQHDANKAKKNGTQKPWNKGLTKENSNYARKLSKTLKSKYESGEIKSWSLGLTKETDERLKQLSESLKEYFRNNDRDFGGSNPSYNFEYYNKWTDTEVNLDSSWEKLYAEYLDENEIEWIRPDYLNWTDSNGIERKYFPDFYLVQSDTYIDVKNDYLISLESTKQKFKKVIEENQVTLEIISKNDLENLGLMIQR